MVIGIFYDICITGAIALVVRIYEGLYLCWGGSYFLQGYVFGHVCFLVVLTSIVQLGVNSL